MFYVLLLSVGFSLFPCVRFLSRFLNLDETDSNIMFLVSLPMAAFILILGFLGVFYRVY